MQPCFTPILIGKGSEDEPSHCSSCNLFSTTWVKALPSVFRREIPGSCGSHCGRPFSCFLVTMYGSLIFWGTVPSSQHYKKSWCRWRRSGVLFLALMTSGGMSSFPGGLLQTKKSMALSSSSSVSGMSSSSIIGIFPCVFLDVILCPWQLTSVEQCCSHMG